MTPPRAIAADELTRALDRDELVLVYQPIVDLHDGYLGGVEALVRWNHPTRGLLWPGEFLSAVDDQLLWSRLGRFVIDAAARQAATWRTRAPGHALAVLVNVASAHFESDDLVVQVARAQHDHDLDRGSLALQIGERVLFRDVARARSRTEALSELGAQVVVDDFGTRYVHATNGDGAAPANQAIGATDGLLLSLVAIEDFTVDVIAIDRRLLERLFTGAPDAALVDAVLKLTHRLGFRVRAVGIETAAEAEQLRRCGCDLAQGYYFHRPQTPEYVEILLREEREARRSRVLSAVPAAD